MTPASGQQQNQLATDTPGAMIRGGGGFIAAAGVVAACGLAALTYAASRAAEPLVVTVLAGLAAVGLFFILGSFAGYFRLSQRTNEQDAVETICATFADGIQVTSRDGRVVYANPAFAMMVGDGDGLRLGSVDQLVDANPAGQEALFRLYRSAESGVARTESICVARAGVPERWLALSVQPAVHAGWGEGLCIWRVVDITADRQRDAKLQASLAQRLAVYDGMPAGFLVTDGAGRIQHINSTLARWLFPGATADKIPADLMLADVLTADGLASLKSLAASTQDDGGTAVRLDHDLVRQDGLGFSATLLVKRRPDGDGLAVTVTERVGGQRTAAGGLETDATRLFDSAPIGIATLGNDGRLIGANSAFSRLLLLSRSPNGSNAELLLGRGLDLEKRKALSGAIAAALAGQLKIAPVEIAIGPQKELTRRIYLAGLSGDREGEEAAVIYMIDATEQKALEQKYSQSQKMEAIGKLAGGIAHDFNNVLTAIIGWSDLLLGTQRPGDPGFKNLINIKSSANRAAGLVNQLLAFSRQQTLQPETLQLGEVLSDLSVLLNRLLGEKINLKISQGRDLWYVKADRTQFSQVVINLAVNARDAMPDGGRLTVRTKNITESDSRKLVPAGVAPGEYVMVEVEDTGSGMSPDVMAKIFEPFFTTKGIGKGTGLGLSTVYGIVNQTGGFVVPQSEIGKGTTFRVYLPRHAAEPTPVPVIEKVVRKDRSQDLTGTGRVLLVEDEDAVRSFAVEALRRQGYDVLQASNGREGLELMKHEGYKVDMIVSDVIMPEMDGPTMLTELRKVAPHLRIIFMSGYPDDAFKANLDSGVKFAFLPKPFSLAQLAAKVKEELQR